MWGKECQTTRPERVHHRLSQHPVGRGPRASTLVVGTITALFMLLGALSSGLGGALISLAISLVLTGLYVLLTGRRSWAWLPARRGAGGVTVAVSLVLFIAG